MKNLREYTKQEAFDIVWKGFEKQDWRVAMDDGICMYRTGTGDKCAIGHLIPDEIYDQMPILYKETSLIGIPNNKSENSVHKFFNFTRTETEMELYEFFLSMQKVHDNSVNNLKEKMIKFAKNWELTIPEAGENDETM